MVRKLLKHEAAYYARTLFILEIVLFAVAISTRFIMFFEYDHWIYYVIQASAFIAFFLTVIACQYFGLAITIVRFYKNLFSREGYLTFALPVSTKQHLFVKLLGALVYNGIITASVFIAGLITISGDLLNEMIKASIYLFSQLFETIDFKDSLNLAVFMVYALILVLLSAICSFLVFYTCIALGQLSKKNRILMAVVYYGIYTLAMQAISTVFSIIMNFGMIFLTAAATPLAENIIKFIENNPYLCTHIFFIIAIISTVIFNAVMYFIIHQIISKKLNLE